jgi:hypothetical protein
LGATSSSDDRFKSWIEMPLYDKKSFHLPICDKIEDLPYAMNAWRHIVLDVIAYIVANRDNNKVPINNLSVEDVAARVAAFFNWELLLSESMQQLVALSVKRADRIFRTDQLEMLKSRGRAGAIDVCRVLSELMAEAWKERGASKEESQIKEVLGSVKMTDYESGQTISAVKYRCDLLNHLSSILIGARTLSLDPKTNGAVLTHYFLRGINPEPVRTMLVNELYLLQSGSPRSVWLTAVKEPLHPFHVDANRHAEGGGGRVQLLGIFDAVAHYVNGICDWYCTTVAGTCGSQLPVAVLMLQTKDSIPFGGDTTDFRAIDVGLKRWNRGSDGDKSSFGAKGADRRKRKADGDSENADQRDAKRKKPDANDSLVLALQKRIKELEGKKSDKRVAKVDVKTGATTGGSGGGRTKRKDRPDKAKIVCVNCDAAGHYAVECPKPCRHCGTEGNAGKSRAAAHSAWDCPKNGKAVAAKTRIAEERSKQGQSKE